MRSLLFEELNDIRSGIIGISASGKQGKSALAYSLIHHVPNFARRGKYLLEFSDVDVSMFHGYSVVQDLNDVPPDSVVVIEDLARHFQGRQSGSETFLPRYLGSVSHKDIVIIFTVQNLTDADISLFRLQNFIDLHKIMFEEDIQFERQEYRAIQAYSNYQIQKKAAEHPEVDIKSLVYSTRCSEVSSWPLVPWWSDRCAYYLRDVQIPRKDSKKVTSNGN